MKKFRLIIFTFISLFIFMGSALAETFYFEGDSLKVKFTSNYGDSKGKEVVATYIYNANYADGPAFQLLDSNPHYYEYYYSTSSYKMIILVKSLTSQTGLSSDQIPVTYGGTKKASEEEKKKEEEQKKKDYKIQYFQNGSSVSVGYQDYNANQYITVDYKMCVDAKTGDITYSLHPYMDENDGCKITDIHTYVSKEADNAAKAGAKDSFNCNSAPKNVTVECNSIKDPDPVGNKTDDGTIDIIDDGCGGVFGDPNDPNYIAYYLQLIFNIMKFLGPILVIVMSIIDLLKVTAEQKQDGELEKLGGKTLKRLIYAIIIFVLPTLINYLFGLVGLYGTCGIK